MSKDSTKAASNILLGADWHDSIEACVRTQIRGFIELMLEAELSTGARAGALCAGGRARALVGGERIGARGDRCSGGTARGWAPQRSSRSRADRNVREDNDISSTRTPGGF